MKNSRDKKTLGKIGEELAVKFLRNKGLRILNINWTYQHKEIDIVAENNDYLIMVEVKTRNISFVESPEEMIPMRKQKALINAAEAYIMIHDIDKETRFDVIIVVFENKKPTIEHIEDAFQPGII
ncbi:MAG: YraN family protein [Bacteroidales bacterium]|nr:YraN family protein [Bacteroidales bacterium]MBS3774398.1 YraN family protein [Bacteroidales bacterium]